MGLPSVLVTGAAGFVGSSLIRSLAAAGHQVVALYRNRQPVSGEKVYPTCSDLRSVELLLTPLRGIDIVIHLAWNNPFSSSEGSYPISANEEAFSHLVQACEKTGVRRVVLLSAFGSDKKSTSKFLQEKYQCEGILLNSEIGEKVILRSSIIYGMGNDHDRYLKALFSLFRYPIIYPAAFSQWQVAPMKLHDIVSILQDFCRSEPIGRNLIFRDIVGTRPLAYEEVLRTIAKSGNFGHRIPLKGRLGRTYLQFLERKGAGKGFLPKMSQFLEIPCYPSSESNEFYNRHDISIDDGQGGNFLKYLGDQRKGNSL